MGPHVAVSTCLALAASGIHSRGALRRGGGGTLGCTWPWLPSSELPLTGCVFRPASLHCGDHSHLKVTFLMRFFPLGFWEPLSALCGYQLRSLSLGSLYPDYYLTNRLCMMKSNLSFSQIRYCFWS